MRLQIRKQLQKMPILKRHNLEEKQVAEADVQEKDTLQMKMSLKMTL